MGIQVRVHAALVAGLVTAALTVAGCSDGAVATKKDSGKERPGKALQFFHLEASMVGAGAYRDEKSALAANDGELPDGARLVTAAPDQVMSISENGRFDRAKGVYLVLSGDPLEFDSDDITAASAKQPLEPPPGSKPDNDAWYVELEFDGAAKTRLTELTAEVARAGKQAGMPHTVGVVFDGRLRSAPVIDFAQYPKGISSSTFAITGLTRDEAREIARSLS